MKKFIEENFPVSLLSIETFKERKSGSSQILNKLGRWWGRKPLSLIRANILGMLMPVSNDKDKDLEIFLKILQMDDNGFIERKNKNVSISDIYSHLSDYDKIKYFETEPKLKFIGSKEEFKLLEKNIFLSFDRMTRLKYCLRIDQTDGLINKDEWVIVNSHLNTNAFSLSDLIKELGINEYGHVPVLGDAFAGGGSIPFEGARMGCNTVASDLNPLAGLFNLGNFSVLKDKKSNEKLYSCALNALSNVEKNINDLNIEGSVNNDKVKTYHYILEVVSPLSGYTIPLFTSFEVAGSPKGSKYKTYVELIENKNNKNFDINVLDTEHSPVTKNTNLNFKKNKVFDPVADAWFDLNSDVVNYIDDSGNLKSNMRQWGKLDYKYIEGDVFSVRLFMIQYVDSNNKNYFVTPSLHEFNQEKIVDTFVNDNIENWLDSGLVPDDVIDESNYNTNHFNKRRGWIYWHQLFSPRQLIFLTFFLKEIEKETDKDKKIFLLLTFNTFLNRSSKLSSFSKSGNGGGGDDTFLSQSLNLLTNSISKGSSFFKSTIPSIKDLNININSELNIFELKSAEHIEYKYDLLITDPPYSDAVNYHEITPFFLNWDKKTLNELKPEWYSTTKKNLVVRGKGKTFNEKMIDVYTNLYKQMADNGLHTIHFTHSDPKVWVELTTILWAAGFKVSSAWTIATEANSAKKGKAISATVVLTLRKRINPEIEFLEDIFPEIEVEVEEQIKRMQQLDKGEVKLFNDNDYQLAAYTASLKILTNYEYHGFNPVKELLEDTKENKFKDIIESAIKIASKFIIPTKLDKNTWLELTQIERFYIKCIDFQSKGHNLISMYDELSRNLNISNYTEMCQNTEPNKIRLKNPIELDTQMLNNNEFSKGILRPFLYSVNLIRKDKEGIYYLRNNTEYEKNKKNFNNLIEFFLSNENELIKTWEQEIFISIKKLKQDIERNIR